MARDYRTKLPTVFWNTSEPYSQEHYRHTCPVNTEIRITAEPYGPTTISNTELPTVCTLRTAPLFQTLASTHLSKLSQHAIRLFKKYRDQYLAAVADRRSHPGGGDQLPLSLLSSFY